MGLERRFDRGIPNLGEALRGWWEGSEFHRSRVQARSNQSSLRDFNGFVAHQPTSKLVGYFQTSLWDGDLVP